MGDEWLSRNASSHARLIFDKLHGIQRDSTHHFCRGAGAHDERITRRPRCDESCPEAAGEREHCHENAHSARDTENGHDRGRPTRPDAAEIVRDRHRSDKGRQQACKDSANDNQDEQQRHNGQDRDQYAANQFCRHPHTLRSASTTRMRIAPKPGRIAAATPTASAARTPITITCGVIRRDGSRPAIARLRTGTAAKASKSPTHPIMAITRDSPRMKPRMVRSENPIAFRTASSGVRSRTEIAMVLPVTSNSVKNTTVPIVTIRNLIFPNCLTQLAAKADSVCVLVSSGAFINMSSIVLAMRGASSGLSICRVYQPIWPLIPSGTLSSK